MRQIFDVLIYAEDEEQFTGEGLCGPLPAQTGTVSEEAGGDYTVSLELPYDEAGRWHYVQQGCVAKAWTQTRQLDGTVKLGPQLFDVIDVSWTLDGLSCTARHVFYRLMHNVTSYRPTSAVTLAQCVQGILDGCVEPHGFTATVVGETAAKIVEGWDYVNAVDALLDPETGALALFGAGIVRDNWEMIIGPGLGTDRGVSLEVGKNLAGVTVSEDGSEVATAILPLGRTADGEPLALPEVLILSDHAIAGHLRIATLEVEGAEVGDGTTVQQAYTLMRAAANQALAEGADAPTVSVTVDVEQVDAAAGLGLPVAVQQAMIEQLEPMPIYDLITLRFCGIEIKEQMLRREWDCLRGRLSSCELGTTQDGLAGMTLATWQVPSGISGTKLSPGTVPGYALQSGAISSGQISAATRDAIAAQAAVLVEAEMPRLTLAYAYPVGSVYGTTDSGDPGDVFGGTWASLGSASQGGATVYYWGRVS